MRLRSTRARSLFTSKGRASTHESGFTLLELLVALTLAAIISLIIAQVGTDSQKMYDSTITTVETYQKFRYALDDINENLSKMVPTASLEFYQDQGDFPADNVTAGIEAVVNITGKYVTGVAVAAGVITVTYGRDADAKIAGATLTMTPLDNAGSVSWTCASAPRLQNKWLPAACRP